MRFPTAQAFIVVLLLLSRVTGANGQQGQTDASIDQLRGQIQAFEMVVADASVPAETRNEYSGILVEKRGQLHSLLRQKRQELRDRVGAIASASDRQSVERAIEDLTVEMRKLEGAVGVRSGSGENKPEPRTPSEVKPTGNNPPPASSENREPQGASPLGKATPSEVVQGPAPAGQAVLQSLSEQYQIEIKKRAQLISEAKRRDSSSRFATLEIHRDSFLIALALAQLHVQPEVKRVQSEFTSQAENARNDKQVGSGQNSGGTTSLALKGGVPAILGFAVENGALTKSTSGTTVTFSGNPVGIIEALAKRGFIDSYQSDDHFDRFLRNFGFSFSFDTSRGSSPGTFTGDKQQLSAYSLRYNLIDQRDPRHKKYTDRWASLVDKQGVEVTHELARFFQSFVSAQYPVLDQWLQSARKAVTDASPDDVEKVLTEQLEGLSKVDLPPDLSNLISSIGKSFEGYLAQRDDILQEISNGWLSTVEYNNQRRLGLPSLSNITFVAEKGAYHGSIDLTANVAASFFNSRPAGANGSLRSISVAGQLDVPLGNIVRTGKSILSLSGRFERVKENEIIPESAVMMPKGNIAIGQIKLTIPIRGTAFKIPISVTFANRTELIKERKVRGNFGFTFDLDSLLAKSNPFTQK